MYPPGGTYELWCGDRMLYLQHPLALAWIIKQFPSAWGISAPGVTVDLSRDVNLYLDTHDRGWYSDLGCRNYTAQYANKTEFRYVAYALSVLNALWQHYDFHGVPTGVHVRYFARANTASNMMRMARYHRLAWDPVTLSFAIGSVVTYDWDNQEVMALCITGDRVRHNLIRLMQDLRLTTLDAGYRIDRIIGTNIPNVAGLDANIAGLYDLSITGNDDQLASESQTSSASSRRRGN